MLLSSNFDLKYEVQIISGFLILYISNCVTGTDNNIKFNISCLIHPLLLVIGINEFYPKYISSIQTPLFPYIFGAHSKETDKCSYSATVNMLQNLSSNTQPDIKLDVN